MKEMQRNTIRYTCTDASYNSDHPSCFILLCFSKESNRRRLNTIIEKSPASKDAAVANLSHDPQVLFAFFDRTWESGDYCTNAPT